MMMNCLRAIVVFAVILYASTVVALRPPAASAQSSTGIVNQLDRRIERIEGEKLGERMARLEAIVEAARATGETNYKLLLGVFGTVALVLMERLWAGGQSVRRKRAPLELE
jgi:hypothetical protein